ncbi:MAG: type II secretion system protein [Opitutales bacterium]
MKKQSKKGFTLVEIMIVVVIIGLLAAMAIPAFQKVREQAREKAMTNNLRQIASAGQQYILEEGTSSVGYTDLVGSYFNEIDPVGEEDYTTLTLSETGGTIEVSSGTQTVVYTY